jgi:hypothetical protein
MASDIHEKQFVPLLSRRPPFAQDQLTSLSQIISSYAPIQSPNGRKNHWHCEKELHSYGQTPHFGTETQTAARGAWAIESRTKAKETKSTI